MVQAGNRTKRHQEYLDELIQIVRTSLLDKMSSGVNFGFTEVTHEETKSICGKKKVMSSLKKTVVPHLEENILGNFENKIPLRKFVYDDNKLILQSDLHRSSQDASNILETGFNAGFSTLMMLTSNKYCKVTSFGATDQAYSKLCAEFLKAEFSNRFEFIEGDIFYSLENFRKDYPNLVFDLFYLDGSNKVEDITSDIFNCYLMKDTSNKIILNSTREKPIRKLWNMAVSNSIIVEEEIHHESFRTGKFSDFTMQRSKGVFDFVYGALCPGLEELIKND